MNFSTAFGKFPRAFFFFFRSKRSLVSVGYWKKKLQILLVKTVVFVKGVLEERKYENLSFKKAELSRGHWREKVSDLFGQTAHFSPVGSGRKKFPKKRTTSPVSVKWVLNEEIFKIFRSKPAKPSSGY